MVAIKFENSNNVETKIFDEHKKEINKIYCDIFQYETMKICQAKSETKDLMNKKRFLKNKK